MDPGLLGLHKHKTGQIPPPVNNNSLPVFQSGSSSPATPSLARASDTASPILYCLWSSHSLWWRTTHPSYLLPRDVCAWSHSLGVLTPWVWQHPHWPILFNQRSCWHTHLDAKLVTMPKWHKNLLTAVYSVPGHRVTWLCRTRARGQQHMDCLALKGTGTQSCGGWGTH